MMGWLLAPFMLLSSAMTADAGSVGFMGWGDVSFRSGGIPEAPANFDQGHLYLLADARVNSAWSLFTEIELESLPQIEDGDSVGELKTDRVYIEFAWNHGRLRFGKFNTPFGIRIPTHWTLLTPMLSKPAIEALKDVQPHVVGIEAHSEVPVGNHELAMTAVVHNGIESSGTDKPVDGITGLAADLSLTIASLQRVGVSYFCRDDPGTEGSVQQSFSGYFDLPLPANLMLRAESVQFFANSPQQHDAHYALVTYTLHFYDPLTVGYRLGLGSSDMVDTGADVVVHTANMSWVPADAVRIVSELEHAAQVDGEVVGRSAVLSLGASF